MGGLILALLCRRGDGSSETELPKENLPKETQIEVGLEF